MQLKFGKFKGKEVSEVALSEEGVNYLTWLKKNTDPNDVKFGKTNRVLLAEIDQALASKMTYVKDSSHAPKKPFKAPSNDFEQKVLSDLALIKKSLGIVPESQLNGMKKSLDDYKPDEVEETGGADDLDSPF